MRDMTGLKRDVNHPWRLTVWRLGIWLLASTILAGCGQVSYKRGGSQQDIDRAHQACRGKGDQFAACLGEQGWQKPQVDALDPLFATIEDSDNRQDTQRKPEPFLIPVTEASPEVAKASSPGAPPTVPASPVVANKKAATAEFPPAPISKSTANDGPDVVYSVNSWWKMGAFPAQLKRDQTQCEQQLGPDYQPDYKTQHYKRAFVSCMHDLGWMAIRNLK